MELFAVVLFLLYASRESFTIKVEVQEGAESVVLPCQYNQVLEEVVTVKWSRRDLNPSIVHQRREGDDLQLQNQLFSGRTSMRSDALDSGDFSLTLRDFQPSDIGNYICSMIDEHEEKTLSEVELQLKASQDSLIKKVEVQWAQSVVLPCQYDQPLEEMVTVKWSRLDLNLSTVHQRREGDDLESQNQLFKGRTSMRADAFDSGDFSLTLSELQLSDSGNYICSIIDDEEKELILSEVQLHVKEIPTWLTVLLVLLGLLVFAGCFGCPLYCCRHKLGSVSARTKILLGVLVVLVVLSVSGGLLFHFQHKFKSEIPAWAILVMFLLFFFTVDVGFVPYFRQKYNSETSTCCKSCLVLWALLLLVCPTVLVSLLFHFRHSISEIPFLWMGIMTVWLLFFQSGKTLFHVQKYLPSGRSAGMRISLMFLFLLPVFLFLVLLVLRVLSRLGVISVHPDVFLQFPTWARIFLILLVLLFLTIEVGLLIRFRQQFTSNRPRRPETVQSEETIALR
ncbi:uncharacterized protein LOC122839737 isoform X3 [Gambusia affinis]|uniref:uncharacterized protein LOC122839737 isoform X3 n=1 Tax=Gambusia affinis TaxID=33528 RepID=UPI001CDCDA2D|nr:uncharacterized protein LOC122839737 isoform X3 [Gambusia affinis]